MTLKHNEVLTGRAPVGAANSQTALCTPINGGWNLGKLDPFDYLVLAGGVVNLVVIIGIIGFWLAGG